MPQRSAKSKTKKKIQIGIGGRWKPFKIRSLCLPVANGRFKQ
jgi:hypothetical protein